MADRKVLALPAVGVLDMLRYHTFTAGAGWAYDYGTAEQSKEMFDYLIDKNADLNLLRRSSPRISSLETNVLGMYITS